MTEPKLLPCPFCNYGAMADERDAWMIHCTGCGVRASLDVWNRRSPDRAGVERDAQRLDWLEKHHPVITRGLDPTGERRWYVGTDFAINGAYVGRSRCRACGPADQR